MSSSTVIPVITFAAGLGAAWAKDWLGNRREDRLRFHAERLEAASDVLARVRYATDMAAQHGKGSREANEALRDHARAVMRISLLFPALVRKVNADMTRALVQYLNSGKELDDDALAHQQAEFISACRQVLGQDQPARWDRLRRLIRRTAAAD